MRKLAYRDKNENQPLGQVPRYSTKANKTIPFDYVFEIELTGERGNKVQDVVQISIEGVFVSTSVGYSLVPNEQISFPPILDQSTIPQVPALVPFFDTSNLLNGILVTGMPNTRMTILKANEAPPHIEKFVMDGFEPDDSITGHFVDAILPAMEEDIIKPGGDRNVILNFPSITADGLIRVWDRTNNLFSEFFDVGSRGTREAPATAVIGPDRTTRRLPAPGTNTLFVYGVPKNVVSVFLLKNANGAAVQIGEPVALSRVENIFDRSTGVAQFSIDSEQQTINSIAAGDALMVRSQLNDVDIDPVSIYAIPRPKLSTVPLGALSAGLEVIGADLTRGFRLNPKFVNITVADLPLDLISPDSRDKIFQTGCSAAEEVSFLYSIDSVSTGREFQSQPIHNIAGLGIANGDRPFRPFAKPIVFEPRSSIRIQIEELSGPPGKLFIVFHGYKILGTGEIPE
jgi:hypothetical protein